MKKPNFKKQAEELVTNVEKVSGSRLSNECVRITEEALKQAYEQGIQEKIISDVMEFKKIQLNQLAELMQKAKVEVFKDIEKGTYKLYGRCICHLLSKDKSPCIACRIKKLKKKHLGGKE